MIAYQALCQLRGSSHRPAARSRQNLSTEPQQTYQNLTLPTHTMTHPFAQPQLPIAPANTHTPGNMLAADEYRQQFTTAKLHNAHQFACRCSHTACPPLASTTQPLVNCGLFACLSGQQHLQPPLSSAAPSQDSSPQSKQQPPKQCSPQSRQKPPVKKAAPKPSPPHTSHGQPDITALPATVRRAPGLAPSTALHTSVQLVIHVGHQQPTTQG